MEYIRLFWDGVNGWVFNRWRLNRSIGSLFLYVVGGRAKAPGSSVSIVPELKLGAIVDAKVVRRKLEYG